MLNMIEFKLHCLSWERDNVSWLHHVADCRELHGLLGASQPCKSLGPFFSSVSPYNTLVLKNNLLNYTLVLHLSLQSHVFPLYLAVP